MVAQPTMFYTIEQYLQLERAGDQKHEYLDGQIYAMAGNSEIHNLISAHILGILYGQLRKRPCRAYPSDMRVKVARSKLYTYPDISIVCGPSLFDDAQTDTLLNPTVVFEILSPSTESYDRGKKFEHYRSLPSLQEYILISQSSYLVEQFVRQNEHVWLLTLHNALDHQLHLQSGGASLLLEDIYENIVLGTDSEPAQE